jgi:hypothetical protein
MQSKTDLNKYLTASGNPDEFYDLGFNLGFKPITKLVICKDGFSLSVQASEGHYCMPRYNTGPWYKVEVGFPSQREEVLMPYAEDKDSPTGTVYGYVPIQIVEELIDSHGGMV